MIMVLMMTSSKHIPVLILLLLLLDLTSKPFALPISCLSCLFFTPYQTQQKLHQRPNANYRRQNRSLSGISEWRDMMVDDQEQSSLFSREICVLPFDYREVLLQGETKQLRLYEDRFVQLFDHAMQKHGGVLAMGLLAETGIVQTVPLCEIEAYNRVDGFGIFVTIRVVARGRLSKIRQQTPYLRAICTEITDDIPPNLELTCLVASNIENYMLLLSSMEHQLETKQLNAIDDDDKDRLKRVQWAQLEDTYYDDDDDDDEDEETVVSIDRRKRFRKAYEVALSTDTQGYQVVGTTSSTTNPTSTGDRTPRELTAISWAAFCTEILPEEDAAVRIQAIDCDNLLDRLKLALALLRRKKVRLRKQMERAGLKFRNFLDDDDFDDKSSSIE